MHIITAAKKNLIILKSVTKKYKATYLLYNTQ